MVREAGLRDLIRHKLEDSLVTGTRVALLGAGTFDFVSLSLRPVPGPPVVPPKGGTVNI